MVKLKSGLVFLFAGIFLNGCATIPGKTRQEQIETIHALTERTLNDLEVQYPQSKDQISQSVGYVIMNNKITKVPIVGAGAGYGVAVDSKTGNQSYLRMARFDVGAGWGARSVRPVIIFFDAEKFSQFIDGLWDLKLGTEASAKVGDVGKAGGAGSSSTQSAYVSYILTDAGVSATASLAVIRVKPIKLKK